VLIRRLLPAVLVAVMAACSSASDDTVSAPVESSATSGPPPVATASATPEPTTPPTSAGPKVIEHVYGTTEVPADPQRIVALSEEFLLADLLAFGVSPIASNSNDTSGFLGLDPAATEGIEVIPSAEFNLEALAALRPDLILAYPDYIDLVGYDLLDAVAPTVAIGTSESDWRDQLRKTAAVFGLENDAEARIAAIDAELDDVRSVLDGQEMSVASVAPGPFIRAFTDERTQLTEIMAELGVVFVPGGGDTDDNGRIEVSLEQLGVLSAPVLVLLQSSFVEGVDQALADVEASPLWATLPAVQDGTVVELDQLSYFGADGVAAFARDLASGVSG
jgi:iron complex transport system substrate-binding protein